MDSRELKERILAAVPIESYIGRTVSLRRSGRGFIGQCPFHKDKSPSFSVLPDPGTFRCFGCGKSGDLFSFVMEREGVEFREALDLLADYAGLERSTGTPNPTEQRAQKLIEVNEAVVRNYREMLLSPEGNLARGYLAQRGVAEESQSDFELGLAPASWQWLSERIGRAGELRELGLVKEGRKGVFDFFRARLMFPIRDERGRAVGFGGRVLPGDENPAKYINSTDSLVFHKGRLLYGLHRARDFMRAGRECFVVEGYLDVIGLFQAGVKTAVAPLGTALGTEHLKLIRRYCDRIVFLYDGDAAGRAAAVRGARSALDEGEIGAFVVLLPPGKDPFDLSRELAPDALKQALEQRLSAARFLAVETMFPNAAAPPPATPDYARSAREGYEAFSAESLGIEEKRAARGRLLQLIKDLKRESDRDLFLNEGARILRVDPAGLRRDAEQGRTGGRKPGESLPNREIPEARPRERHTDRAGGTGQGHPAQVHREHQILQWLILHPAQAATFLDEVSLMEFADPLAESLWRHLEARLLTGDLWTPESLASGELPGELLALVLSLTPGQATGEFHSLEGFRGLLLTHRAHAIKTEVRRLEHRLEVADSVERDEIIGTYTALMQEERRIAEAIRGGADQGQARQAADENTNSGSVRG